MTEISKAEWRERAKTNRVGLTIDHARVSLAIRRHFERHPASGWIVGFDALPGEPNISSLFTESWAKFALTRTPADDGSESSMELTLHPHDVEQETHRYGFRQPVADAAQLSLADVGAVLVPGLAFDMGGTRLGHGAGYYDRFLSRLNPTVPRIGVSDGYIVSRLPADDHDVPMTHLATEAGVMNLSYR